MTLRSKHIVPIVLVVFILGIGGTIVFNLWQTTSSKIPAAYTSGEFAGQYNPGDIRGSYSFGDIEKAFEVPAQALAEAFGVQDSDNPAAFLCKELEDLYAGVEDGEVGTDSVRWFVALYTGLPYTPEEDSLLPSPAARVLKDRIGETELEQVKAKTVSLSNLEDAASAEETAAVKSGTAEAGATEAGAAEEHSEVEIGQVRGKTTFGELLNWGVSKEEIEQALGLPIGKAGISVRDYCIQNDIEFSIVKGALQSAADRALNNE
jgi:hypothetical protein